MCVCVCTQYTELFDWCFLGNQNVNFLNGPNSITVCVTQQTKCEISEMCQIFGLVNVWTLNETILFIFILNSYMFD